MGKGLRQYLKGWLEVVIGWLDKERKPAPPIPHFWRDYMGPIMFCIGLALAIPGAIIIAGNTHQMMSTEEAAANPPTELEKSVYNSPCPKNTDLRASDLCAQWKAADAARKSAEWGVTAFIVGTVVNVLTLIGVGFGWLETRKASGAALEQVKVARDGLSADSRAWLSLKCENIGNFEFDEFLDDDVFLKVEYQIQNVGNSPATGVKVQGRLIATDFLDDLHFKDLRKYCEEIIRLDNNTGKAIFPGIDFVDRRRSVAGNIDDINEVLDSSVISLSEVHVLSCVTYRSPHVDRICVTGVAQRVRFAGGSANREKVIDWPGIEIELEDAKFTLVT